MPQKIIKEKKLTMFCARCQKEQEKLGFLDSDSNSIFDGYLLFKSYHHRRLMSLPPLIMVHYYSLNSSISVAINGIKKYFSSIKYVFPLYSFDCIVDKFNFISK